MISTDAQGLLTKRELARLIVDVDADGVFLDTLGMITPEFRQAIDRHKPASLLQ